MDGVGHTSRLHCLSDQGLFRACWYKCASLFPPTTLTVALPRSPPALTPPTESCSFHLPNMLRLASLLVLVLALVLPAACSSPPHANCTGSANYRITFFNFLNRRNFGSLIPRTGLVFSPLAAVSHSNRISLLTVRGFASPQVQAIAELGDNEPLLNLARRLRREGLGVKSVAAAMGPTMPGGNTSLEVMVDCENPFVTVIGMIAPSPDWIVQISNFDLVSNAKTFLHGSFGYLIAYDGGTDSGRNFTDPADTSLDIPTDPPLNIAPLVEDDTDRFEGRFVGRYVIRRIR